MEWETNTTVPDLFQGIFGGIQRVAYGKPVEECPGTLVILEENKRILMNESEGVGQGFCHLLWVPLWVGLLKGHVSITHHSF